MLKWGSKTTKVHTSRSVSLPRIVPARAHHVCVDIAPADARIARFYPPATKIGVVARILIKNGTATTFL